MKCSIDIVCGFLGSGKTSFINALIEADSVENEKIMVLQMENGRKSVNIKKNIDVNMAVDLKHCCDLIINEIKKRSLDKIIIEYNGTMNMQQLLEMIKDKNLKGIVKSGSIYFIADCRQLKIQMNNLNTFMVPFIKNAHLIFLNNIDYCESDVVENYEKNMRRINPNAYILKNENSSTMLKNIRKADILESKLLKNIKIKLRDYFAG